MEETYLEHAWGVVSTIPAVKYTPKGVRFIGHFLEERCYLYREVYSHKRAVSADHLLSSAVALMSNDIVSCLTPQTFERLDDGYVLNFAWKEGHPAAAYLLDYMRGRQPNLVEEGAVAPAQLCHPGTFGPVGGKIGVDSVRRLH